MARDQPVIEDHVGEEVAGIEIGEMKPETESGLISPVLSTPSTARCWSISKPRKQKFSKEKVLTNVAKGATTIAQNNATVNASPSRPMPLSRPLPLLVCSIGNPGQRYADTLHSAGHIVLSALASHLNYPPFHKDRTYGNGLISAGDWTLWQSTSYMNESGKGVRAAYTAFNKTVPVGEEQARLIVVHDELEKPLGSLSVKTKQGLSARGHNGLKSILASLGNVPFVRVGVGIDRPVSRSSADVAEYVLSRVSERQKLALEGCVGQLVEKLMELEKG